MKNDHTEEIQSSNQSLGYVHECISCEKTFENKLEMKQHMNTEHGYECEFCGKHFIAKSQVKNHMETDVSIKFDVCDISVHTQDELKKHREASHALTCKKCNKTYKSLRMPGKSTTSSFTMSRSINRICIMLLYSIRMSLTNLFGAYLPCQMNTTQLF